MSLKLCVTWKTENSSVPWEAISAFKSYMSLVADFERENHFLQKKITKYGTTL